MKCATVDCSNEARYINERGELCCGLCPIKQGIDSIRILDVPHLLRACRWVLRARGRDASSTIRELIGRDHGGR